MFHHGLGLPWLIALAIAIVPFWRICARVGFNPWLSLLVAVPLVNLIFLYYLAFAEWPVHRSAASVPPTSPPV